MLPDEAQDDIIWAMGELNARRRSQADILFELNDLLEVKGIDPISRSAFNRKSMSLAKRAMQLDERRHVYAGIAEKLTPEEVGKADLVLGEFLKILLDQISLKDDLDSKNLQELGRAYKDIIVGQRHSAEHRAKLEAEAKAKLGKVVDAVEGHLATTEKPDGMAVIKKIREEIYGIFDE